MSSVYGYLSGAWPFGVVEAIWAVNAVRRYADEGLSTSVKSLVASSVRPVHVGAPMDDYRMDRRVSPAVGSRSVQP